MLRSFWALGGLWKIEPRSSSKERAPNFPLSSPQVKMFDSQSGLEKENRKEVS